MKNEIDVNALRGYVDTFKQYSQEYMSICDRIEQMLYFTKQIADSLDRQYFYEVINQMQGDIEKIHNTQQTLEGYANTIEEIARSYEEAAPPFIDFIVNIDIKAWWEQAYPIIEQIATATGAITGVATIAATPLAFIKWIRSKLQSAQKNEEYKWIKFILNREEWNVSILSQQLELTEIEVKKILKGFGYVWDAKKMLYVATDNTHKLRDIKLNNRTFY